MLFYSFLAVLDADDRSCAEQIFEKYHKYIYEIAYNILHKHRDAEDTLNEVMINIMKNIERFNHANRNDIEAQIVIYSRNAAINLYNKNKRRTKVEVPFTYVNDEDELEEIEIEGMGESVDEVIITKETVEIVRRYLPQLSIEQRDVIKLIADMMNIDAVTFRKSHGLLDPIVCFRPFMEHSNQFAREDICF